MKVFGIIGWKNAGKTGLMERLVAHVVGLGFTVSTVKHVHHDVDLDHPGKDSFRHRAAGASEVVLAGAKRFALLREHRGPEPDLGAVLARMAPVNLVLVEGYKRDTHPRIEVFRAETGQQLIQPGDPLVRAVASDVDGLACGVPVLDLNDTAAVAEFILREMGLIHAPPVHGDTRFDTVVVVDWSASQAPSPAKPTADAIWTAVVRGGVSDSTYHRTRALAERHLNAVLALEAAQGRRVLVGFDFPMGYPAGFAARLTGQARAAAVWDWLAARITDGEDNRNNRFAVAAEVNRSFGGAGPFWGCPAGVDLPGLGPTKAVDYLALGLAERRLVEQKVPRAQPVWKLYTTGSVGSQSLMGLPVVHRLAQAGASVWPFNDTPARVVVAEVYPSLLARFVAREGGIKDEAQVRLLARALWRLSQSGGLSALWQVPLAARAEEGWILGAGHVEALEAAL
jgi:molybdopterin-guanine dinucleotide biosynthesis protein B